MCFRVHICSWATGSSLGSGNLNKYLPSHALFTWSCGGSRAALQPEDLALDLALPPLWKVALAAHFLPCKNPGDITLTTRQGGEVGVMELQLRFPKDTHLFLYCFPVSSRPLTEVVTVPA